MKKRGLLRKNSVQEKLCAVAFREIPEVLVQLESGENGLTAEQAEVARDRYGENVVTHGKREPLWKRVVGAFLNPFTAILLVLAGVSLFTDVVLAEPGEKNAVTVAIITAMVALSGVLRFVQETRSGNAAARLSGMIRTTACVERSGQRDEIPLEEVVVGDIIWLSAGDMVPADLRILSAKDLFVSQSALTGESEPVEKSAACAKEGGAVTELSNVALLGSSVISGSARGVAVCTGNDSLLGCLARELDQKPPKTSFEKGVNSVSWVLIRFMLVMVPIVLFVNGLTKGDWTDASLFAISVAVGLTPEMLPMLVTTCLAKGAVAMSGKKVIVKDLNAIQSLGSMDVLCTDKTGTLTQDQVVLEYHLDVMGKEDPRVLRHGFLNSYYQTGLKNLIDRAIIRRLEEEAHRDASLQDLATRYVKVDEVPFDFDRRRMSVVVSDGQKTQMITKGALEEMLKVCAYVDYGGSILPLTEELRGLVLQKSGELNAGGMRVIAVAQKTDPSPVGQFSVADEAEMVLMGYLAFLDPPKESSKAALRALKKYGVAVKVLTGDNDKVTCRICREVGIPAERVLLGEEVETLDDLQLKELAEETTIFAKLSPAQKARVVRLLRENGHCVGYLGDGINDAAAMRAADVGVSVDSAVDVAKESAGVILLEKDLTVLEDGVLEGRRTYANMMKYIKMTASSNFGNMFSVLAASAFLPFLPMASLQLILLNLIYDISCIAVPWDNVDQDYLAVPRNWDAGSVEKFMLWIGPTSSVFDIVTYLLLYFVVCPAVCGGLFHQLSGAGQEQYAAVFQAGWFVESMWTQTLVIHMIRTKRLPFVHSRASLPVFLVTLGAAALSAVIPFTSVGGLLGLAPLPLWSFLFLAGAVAGYMALVTLVKKLYVRRYGELI